MARTASTQPTEVELQILTLLWESGPTTAREIHNRLSENKGTTYSTTVKMLSVMLGKGLVNRNDSVRPQLYRAASTRQHTQKRMLGDLIHKVYDGSATSLVLQALSTKSASKAELDEIRNLIDQLAQRQS